jgi:hypothetical protein
LFLSPVFDPQHVPPEVIEYCSRIGDTMLQLSCALADTHMPTSHDDILESLRHLFEARNKALEAVTRSSLDVNKKLSLLMSFEVAVGPFISLVKSRWNITDSEIIGSDAIADIMSNAKPPTHRPPTV